MLVACDPHGYEAIAALRRLDESLVVRHDCNCLLPHRGMRGDAEELLAGGVPEADRALVVDQEDCVGDMREGVRRVRALLGLHAGFLFGRVEAAQPLRQLHQECDRDRECESACDDQRRERSPIRGALAGLRLLNQLIRVGL